MQGQGWRWELEGMIRMALATSAPALCVVPGVACSAAGATALALWAPSLLCRAERPGCPPAWASQHPRCRCLQEVLLGASPGWALLGPHEQSSRFPVEGALAHCGSWKSGGKRTTYCSPELLSPCRALPRILEIAMPTGRSEHLAACEATGYVLRCVF